MLWQIISLVTGIDVASIVINLVNDVTGSGTQVSISLYFLDSETAAVTYDGLTGTGPAEFFFAAVPDFGGGSVGTFIITVLNGRGLHSSTFQLYLSRFSLTTPGVFHKTRLS